MVNVIDRNSEGVFIISATPFCEDDTIDFASTDKLIDFYIECGVTGITILGIMGEAPKLTQEESIAFAKHVIHRVNNSVPIVVGVSGAGLSNMAALSHSVMEIGAAGVMVAPMGGLTTEQKLKSYYQQVCDTLGPHVPVCLQDYPQTTGVHFSVETIISLAKDNDNLVMLKHEDWPGLNKLSQVRAQTGSADIPRLSILVGNAALFLPQELQRGADGAMTGFAYPEMLVEVVNLHKSGKIQEAEDLFDNYLPMVRYEQQLGLGLAIRKEILRRRGLINSAKVRAPGPVLTEQDHSEISNLMQRLEIKLNGT